MSDDASGKLVLVAPTQYSAALDQPVGATIGRVSAQIEVRALGGVPLTLEGTVLVENPAAYAGNACAPAGLRTVWVATLSVPGQQPIRIPVFVHQDPVVSMQACLPSPDVPESQGGAPLGTKLLQATFTLERVFTPPAAGAFPWFGTFTPYVPGTSTLNAAATVESRALIRRPAVISLRGKRQIRAGKQVAILAGNVTEAGSGVAGAVVRIRGGGSRTTRANSNGRYSVAVPLTRTTTFTASTTVPERDVTATVCPPCVSATAAEFQASSRLLKVVRPRSKPKR